MPDLHLAPVLNKARENIQWNTCGIEKKLIMYGQDRSQNIKDKTLKTFSDSLPLSQWLLGKAQYTFSMVGIISYISSPETKEKSKLVNKMHSHNAANMII